jgi:hypothetical protein
VGCFRLSGMLYRRSPNTPHFPSYLEGILKKIV